ncbi:MAG: endonuclease domain-containing protein [Oscillospiraceae bacterium]|jgi:very-short-patch-repair endonuclease|nr:endonuclease domain-containing protein [Oscillospiraceae bacterium]
MDEGKGAFQTFPLSQKRETALRRREIFLSQKRDVTAVTGRFTPGGGRFYERGGAMFPYPQENRLLARELRNNATLEEKKLWRGFLSKHPARFLRQRPIGRYIVDFYCPSSNLVIEIDGKQHEENDMVESDRIRTEYLNSLGIKVIRFTNQEVTEAFPVVCKRIEESM